MGDGHDRGCQGVRWFVRTLARAPPREAPTSTGARVLRERAPESNDSRLHRRRQPRQALDVLPRRGQRRRLTAPAAGTDQAPRVPLKVRLLPHGAARTISKTVDQPDEIVDALAKFDQAVPNLRGIRNPLTHPSDDSRLDGGFGSTPWSDSCQTERSSTSSTRATSTTAPRWSSAERWRRTYRSRRVATTDKSVSFYTDHTLHWRRFSPTSSHNARYRALTA
jgi:hypothetical protein